MIITAFTASIVFALPAFILRKTIKGLYDCTLGPVINCAFTDKPFSLLKVLNGALNFLSLGLFAVLKKAVKAVIGYSHRFGFPDEGISDFSFVQNVFKSAIELSTKGEFPNLVKGDVIGFYRPFIRLFYGFQHKVESILKTYHDAYLEFANEIKSNININEPSAYSMQLQSPQYKCQKANVAGA